MTCEVDDWLERNALACLVLSGAMNEIVNRNTDPQKGIEIVASAFAQSCKNKQVPADDFSAMCLEMAAAYPKTIAEKRRRNQAVKN